MITVREEQDGDAAGIRRVNALAFETPAEADLVDLLRERDKLLVSLVAVEDERVVGHIAFSSASIEPKVPGLSGAGLGPMAVLPEVQRTRIGSQLVREGLDRCKQIGLSFVVVLGHPQYYPRFGFALASRFGIRCTWTVPDEVFMAMELRPGALAGIRGLTRYEPEFEDV